MPFKVISVPFTFEFDISAERATAPVAGGYGGRVLPLGLRVHQVVCLRDVGESTVRLKHGVMAEVVGGMGILAGIGLHANALRM